MWGATVMQASTLETARDMTDAKTILLMDKACWELAKGMDSPTFLNW